MTPATSPFDTMAAAARSRGQANLARLTARRDSRPGVPAPMVATQPAPEPRPTTRGATRPAWGKLPIDKLDRASAEQASNQSGKAGLRAYLALWGVQ